MNPSLQPNRERRLQSQAAPTLVILLTLAVLGCTIFLATRHFREQFRKQIVGRDARVFYALWLSHRFTDSVDAGLTQMEETPADQLEEILEITRLPPASGALATRLFDTDGNFVVAFPDYVSESRLTPRELERLKNLEPISRFLPAANLTDLSPATPGAGPKKGTRPLLEITVPLHQQDQKRLLGIAQFVLDGESVAAALAALDRTLVSQNWLAFLGSGALVVAVLGLAFHQLQKVNRLLVERTRNLVRANQELTWAAKASAIGAVASHLIHGLKNPLSGLQNFMVSLGPDAPAASDTEWQLAVSTTRRMQSLMNEVVRILREEHDSAHYEISVEELVQVVSAKVAPLAQQANVHFRTRLRAEGMLGNRDANLIILVLENLIQNGIQATPAGKAVTLSLESATAHVICEVRDEGPGLPEACQTNLFKPCQSTKPQGSGIGLAISKQLANAIGAELELRSSSPGGCVFALAVPARLLRRKPEQAKTLPAGSTSPC